MFLVLKYVQNFMKLYKNPSECTDACMCLLHALTFPPLRKKKSCMKPWLVHTPGRPAFSCLLCTWLYLKWSNAGGGRSPWTRQAAQSLSFSLFGPRRSKCRCPLMLRSESSQLPLSNPPPSPNTLQVPHFPSLNHSGRQAGRTLSRVRQVWDM